MTNDFGNYITLSAEQFTRFLKKELMPDEPLYQTLDDDGFLYNEDIEEYTNKHAYKLERMKGCLFSATQLFILVLTNICNQRCIYCQAGEAHAEMMSVDTCKKAIDIAVQSPVSGVTIEFQGGEPTVNSKVIYSVIPYAKELFSKKGKKVNFTIVTNFTEFDENLFRYLIEENVSISTSLDGPGFLHDYNRPLASQASSYSKWKAGINDYSMLCAELGKEVALGALQTTTKYSLSYPHEIVDEYLSNGINTLYIRPLTPLGRAKELWNTIGYTADEYLAFYFEVLRYMITLCKKGRFVKESTASIYLERIINKIAVSHTEYRSPCGGAIGQMAVNFDGQVYTCDEGRMLANMGDNIFCLGTVNNTYKELVQAPAAHAVCTASCIESLPFCSECAYSPFCAVCPVVTYGLENDLITHQKDSYKCNISKGILKFLFDIIEHGEKEDIEVLYSWI